MILPCRNVADLHYAKNVILTKVALLKVYYHIKLQDPELCGVSLFTLETFMATMLVLLMVGN